jgi:hypothetical protein
MKYLLRFNESQEELNSVKQWQLEFKDFCESGLAFILDEAEIEYNFRRWAATNTNICLVEIYLDEAKYWIDIRDHFIPFFQRLNSNYFISRPIEISTKISDRVSTLRNYSYEEVISGEIEPAAKSIKSNDPMFEIIDTKYKNVSVVTVIRFKVLNKLLFNESMTYDEKYDEVLDLMLSKNNPLIKESKESNSYLDLKDYCESNLAFLIDDGYKINFSPLYCYKPDIETWLISIRKSSGNFIHETFTWSDVKDELIRFAYLISKEYKLEFFSTKEFRILLPAEDRLMKKPTIDLSYNDLEKLKDSFKLTAFCIKVYNNL